MNKRGFVYIMSNPVNTVFYTGVSSNLIQRVYQHKDKQVDSFTKRYNLIKLVYYEIFDSIENAIIREKQIKGGSRQAKIDLITSFNPEFRDLYDEL